MDKFKFDIDNFELIDDENIDDSLAIVEVYVCHDGNNRHNLPISREALIKAKDTLKNKFLVAGFDGEDFEGHEPDEQIVGFFPESSKMRLEKRKGRTYLVAQAIMSKVYAKWAYDVFANSGNHRDVSMEIIVTAGEVDEQDNLLSIEEFVFNGVTILGLSHIPACEGSNASIIKFDCENALEEYNRQFEFAGKEVNKLEKEDKVQNVAAEEEVKTVNAEAATEEPKEETKSSEDDKTLYSEEKVVEEEKCEDIDDKDDDKDDVDDDKDDDSKPVDAECDEKACKAECNPTEEDCAADEPATDKGEEKTKEDEKSYEVIKAERDSLLEENKVLKSKVEKYEAKEKLVQVENIISSVNGIFTADEISELRKEAENYSLDNLNSFDNEVKAKAFDKVKDQKFEAKSTTRIAINNTILDNQTSVSKYTW